MNGIIRRLVLFLVLSSPWMVQATVTTWTFDEARDWGSPPDGWTDASSSGSAHTYRNTVFDGENCLQIKTTGGTSDRVKVQATQLFREGTYDWEVYVPPITEPGAQSSIGAFLYSPQSGGDFDAREIDFEIGYGSSETRDNLSIPDDKKVCYMTVQRDDSSETSFSTTIIPIAPDSWYTLRIMLTPDADGDYIARWFIKKAGETDFTESRSSAKCHYGTNDTQFAVYTSVETLSFMGDSQPAQDHEAYFNTVSVSDTTILNPGLGWSDDFDGQLPVANTPPNGYQGVYGVGTLDKGVTDSTHVSPSNSAYVAVDLDGNGGFRSILLHSATSLGDLTGGTISVQLAADVDLSSGAGIVGFHLYDADGSEFGTEPEDRFAPSTSFGSFAQNISDLTHPIVWGDTPGLDTAHIIKYALDFFDPSGTAQTAVFYIDDFEGRPHPFVGDVGVGMSIETNTVDLSWFAGYGSSYQAQFSTNLLSTNWSDLGKLVVGNNTTSHVYSAIDTQSGFFRLNVVQ